MWSPPRLPDAFSGLKWEPGDEVAAANSVVARMLPANPDVLNVRAEEQAEAGVRAAQAALNLASAEVTRAQADLDLAKTELDRSRKLFETDTVAKARLDRDERLWRSARAGVQTADAAVAMREADS